MTDHCAWETRRYGGTMILGASAVIIMSQIDVIMIGWLLDLSLVPAFTIAAFIASRDVSPKSRTGPSNASSNPSSPNPFTAKTTRKRGALWA